MAVYLPNQTAPHTTKHTTGARSGNGLLEHTLLKNLSSVINTSVKDATCIVI